jgi:hypothetical protein
MTEENLIIEGEVAEPAQPIWNEEIKLAAYKCLMESPIEDENLITDAAEGHAIRTTEGIKRYTDGKWALYTV